MRCFFGLLIVILLLKPSPLIASEMVVEHLRLKVPEQYLSLWLDAEVRTWQPWLESQEGFLGRDLYWDPVQEEGVLLIRWASRQQWKAIPELEVHRVQKSFDSIVKVFLDSSAEDESLFSFVDQGELVPQLMPPL